MQRNNDAKRQKTTGSNYMEMSLAFSQIQKRLADTHAKDIETMKKQHEQELSHLHQQLKAVTASNGAGVLDHAQLILENELLSSKLSNQSNSTRSDEIREMMEAIRQRNKSDRELR